MIPQSFVQQSYPPQINNQGYVSQTIPQNFQQSYVQLMGSSRNQGYLPQGYNLPGSTTYGQNFQRNNPQGINTQVSYGFQNPNSQRY